MTNLERVAYIRGLAEGLELDTDKKEVKVLDAMLTLLEDMALSISDLEEAYEDMADQLDAVDEDLCTLEDDFYEEDKCCEDCEDDDDEFYYEVTCPNCKKQFAYLKTLSKKAKLIAQTVVNVWSLISMMYWTTTVVATTAIVMMIAAAALIKKRNPVPVVAAVTTNSILS